MQSTILLSRVALAKRWHVAPRRIKAWTEAGVLPVFVDPITGKELYPLPSVEAWEASHMPKGKAS